jgi:Tfp pilus assembly protein PilN
MRPVNLIPPEDRTGQHAPLRTGPVAYVVIGALVLVLVAVTAMVLTDNQISDSKTEVAKLEREDQAASAEAQRLVAYSQFQALHEARVTTITSLADSRFDWERVMRELALVLPHDVWLVNMDASATPESGGGTGGGNLRGAIKGPALEISGCASGQEAVARFVTALKDIDGVTRVGVESSELPSQGEGAGSTSESGSTGGGSEDCRTRSFIAQFKLVVAFDAAPIPITSAEEGETLASPTEIAQSTSTESTSAESTSAESTSTESAPAESTSTPTSETAGG